MISFISTIIELQTDRVGQHAALIECPAAQLPTPGQYLQIIPDREEDPLPRTLFPSCLLPRDSGADQASFVASLPPSPQAYLPGMQLQLYGPLGKAFELPATVKRLALAAFDASIAPLLPLMDKVLDDGGEVAIFCDVCPDGLPEAVEINPLDELRGLTGWADFAAVTCPLERLTDLNQMGLNEMGARPAQVLIRAPMPCGGLADCGVCAVPAKRGYKLACKDGPVFNMGC